MDFVIDKDEIVIQIAEASKHVQASAPPVEDLILDQVQQPSTVAQQVVTITFRTT